MVKKASIISVIFLSVFSCTIKPPEVHITSEKTALEEQMFGDQARVSNDPSSSVAVWALMEKYSWEEMEAEGFEEYRDLYNKRKLTLAQIRRKTMAESINELKRLGVLGESYDGDIVIMADSIKSDDQINKIVKAENTDRDIILSFYLESSGVRDEKAARNSRIEFGQVMARISPDGTWIEDGEGNWTVK